MNEFVTAGEGSSKPGPIFTYYLPRRFVFEDSGDAVERHLSAVREPLLAVGEQLPVFEEHGAVGARRRRARLPIAARDVHIAVFGDVTATFELLPRDATEIHH